jgi:leucyl aminopeptidase (aminopeptidase T)
MFFHRFLFVVILGVAVMAAANEGESGAETPQSQVYSGKQDQSWEVVQTALTALKGKMEQQAAVVHNLIAEKNSLSGAALQQKMDQIKKEHQKYETLVYEYNQKNDEFLTRYPERGLKEKRVYKRVKMKSLDSFEDDVTLRGRMNKLHNKVLRQYPTAFADQKNKKESMSTSQTTKSSSDDVTNSIKLKK